MHERRSSEAQEKCFNSLRKIELFSSLTDDEIQGIVCNDSLLAFGPGEMVVNKGEIGGSMFVIMEGICSVLIPDPSDETSMMEVAQLKSGSIFGEISALTDAPRTAWIQATGHVLLQEISQSQIEAVFLNNQTAMAEFAKVMATREAGLKTFTLEEKKTFELGLVERMTQTFSKLMSS